MYVIFPGFLDCGFPVTTRMFSYLKRLFFSGISTCFHNEKMFQIPRISLNRDHEKYVKEVVQTEGGPPGEKYWGGEDDLVNFLGR